VLAFSISYDFDGPLDFQGGSGPGADGAAAHRAAEAGKSPGVVAHGSKIAIGRSRLPEYLPVVSMAVLAPIADPFVVVVVSGRGAHEEGRRWAAYHADPEIGSFLVIRNGDRGCP
jgi:hypothetical protein